MKGAVRQKELFVNRTKISVDVTVDDVGTYATAMQLAQITEGCLLTLNNLREQGLRDVIEVFRVTWIKFDKNVPGPSFTVYFRDPLGETCSHSTDYRFVGTGSVCPTASDIERHFCAEGCLPRFIGEHLRSCRKRLEAAEKQLSHLPQRKG